MPIDLSKTYLWFDTEFTSLALEDASLLQVALIATDHELQRISPPEHDFNCVVSIGKEQKLAPWVEKNLPGLIMRCRSTEAVPQKDIDLRLKVYLENLLGPSPADIKMRPILAGNSLHGDWYLARKYLPSLIANTHYRILDVSSWKVIWKNVIGEFTFDKDNEKITRKYFPGNFNSSEKTHDAHYDVLASIAELNFYLKHLSINWPSKNDLV